MQNASSVAVFGASGGLGQAFCDALRADASVSHVYELSRSSSGASKDKSTKIAFDLLDEASIAAAAQSMAANGPLHLVLVATGLLHDDIAQPEKRRQDLNPLRMEHLFRLNTIGPALIAKHTLPLLDRDQRSVFAALSARVGSISDNRLGGWHSYRASKAALNMMLRTLSVELAYKNPKSICVALHPGTVDTALSQPFQRNVAEEKLFTPEYAARRLLSVLESLSSQDTGGFFAWDGEPIPY